jgi:NitT/TauT family transport system ATP-binding protein
MNALLPPIVSLQGVTVVRAGAETPVLENISFDVRRNEIVGLLGRSGSGKSTLLRVVSGLAAPDAGHVHVPGDASDGTRLGIAMVFQSFAVLPWLSARANVELAIDPRSAPRAARRASALDALQRVGLDGYEETAVRSFSGGMRQRVGLARALAVRPRVLLMDEPFSALDVLTAESLRAEILDLWSAGRTGLEAIVLVTHNIEEAVLMCDRILLLGANPGRMVGEIRVPLPRPRRRLDPLFRAFADDVHERFANAVGPRAGRPGRRAVGLAMALPRLSARDLDQVLMELAHHDSGAGVRLPHLARAFQTTREHLLEVLEVLQLLRFATYGAGRARLADGGQEYVAAAAQVRRRLLRARLLVFVPLAAHIADVLHEHPDGEADLRRFQDELEDHISPAAAAATLDSVLDWGRQAQLFHLDQRAGRIRRGPAPQKTG